MVGRREYFRQSSLWHCLSSISFTGASTSSSPVFDIAYPPFPLPSRTLPAVQSLTLPIHHFHCRREHFLQSSLWHCLSSISSADTNTSGSPVFDIAHQAFLLPTRALPAVQSLTLPIQPAGEILDKHRQKKKPQKTGSLQTFLICATKGENWERKDSNLKDLRHTRKWTTTLWGAWKGKRKLDRRVS